MAGSMPLAFLQEDFLVPSFFCHVWKSVRLLFGSVFHIVYKVLPLFKNFFKTIIANITVPVVMVNKVTGTKTSRNTFIKMEGTFATLGPNFFKSLSPQFLFYNNQD